MVSYKITSAKSDKLLLLHSDSELSLSAGRFVPQVMRLPAETYELRGSENIAGRLLYRGPEAVVALNSVFGTFINYWFPTSAASFLPHANLGLI